ncbi:MAG: hypothetical protein NXI31_12430 [bacterium]|nr:hypothetical protein [bacterium]
MPTNARILSLLLAATLSAGPALAQDEPAGKRFVVPAGNVELLELVNQAAEHLRWNILANEAEVQNQAIGGTMLTLQRGIDTDSAGCADALTALLSTKGFILSAMNESQHLYELIAVSGPRARIAFESAPLKTTEQILSRRNLRMPVATVVQLKHIDAMIATNSLRPFFAQIGGSNMQGLIIGTSSSKSTLLISGMQNRVASAILMIRESDVPQPEEVTPHLAQKVESLEARLRKIEQALAQLARMR